MHKTISRHKTLRYYLTFATLHSISEYRPINDVQKRSRAMCQLLFLFFFFFFINMVSDSIEAKRHLKVTKESFLIEKIGK